MYEAEPTDRPMSTTRGPANGVLGKDERPLAHLAGRIRRVAALLGEQTSLLSDAKTNTLNRMIGEVPTRAPTAERDPIGPGRVTGIGGDIGEVEEAIMALEQTVGDVIDHERYITNRLTNVG